MHDINPTSIWQFLCSGQYLQIQVIPVVCFTLQLANKRATIGKPGEDQTHQGTGLTTYKIALKYYFVLMNL